MTAALTRRGVLSGAVAVAVEASMADAALRISRARPAASPEPVGPLTRAQAEAVDFDAVWDSLPPETQARIGALAIEAETFDQLADDGGFHTTAADREKAQTWADDVRADLRPAIWASLPAMLPTTHDEPYPLWQVLESRKDVPAEVDVRGLGLCPLVSEGWQWFARDGGRLVELAGAVDLDNRIPDAPRRWQFWTQADIDAERLRRHPEMAAAGGAP